MAKAQSRYRISERRACRLYRFPRATQRYRSVRPSQEPLRRRLRELALSRPRFGYKRLTVLRRENWKVNHKRVLRLYRDEELMVRTKRRKKRASETRLPLPIPAEMNELWTMDFMSDRLASGRRFRTFNAVDVASRLCVGIAVDTTFTSEAVTSHLDRWIAQYGEEPQGIQVDNGTEFTSNAFDAWAHERGIQVYFITPGRPVENCVIESFTGKLRDECLNANWFESLDQARRQIESWSTDYNDERPHSSLGDLAPARYAANLIEWATP